MKFCRYAAAWSWLAVIPLVRGQADTTQSAAYLIEATRLLLLDEEVKAEQALVQSLDADSSNSAAYVQYASLCASRKNDKQAHQYLEQALTLTPKHPSYYLLGIQIALQSYDFNQAITYYESLLAHIPRLSFSYYQELADLYVRTDTPAKVLHIYQQYEEKYTYTKALGVARAKMYQSQGQWTSEKTELLRLTQTFPLDPTLHILYADRLLHHELHTQALNYLQPIIEKYPHHKLLSWYLGKAYLRSGQYTQAGEQLWPLLREASISMEEKLSLLDGTKSSSYSVAHSEFLEQTSTLLLAYYPKHLRLYQTVATLGKSMDTPSPKLRDYYVAMLQLGLRALWLWKEIIDLELELQAYDSASSHLEEALLYYPNHPMLHYYKGHLLYITQSYTEAKEVLLAAKSLAIENLWKGKITLQLAETYYALGDIEQAETVYLEAIDLQTEDKEAQVAYIAFLLQENRNASTALRLAKELTHSDPKNTAYTMIYAHVLHTQSQCERAKEVLLEELKRKKSSEILQWMGKIYECLGEEEAAQKSFEEAKTWETKQSQYK